MRENKGSMMYDIMIIGAGPAGLTAGIYARRAGKSVLILEKETFGGQITHSPKVENYPGFPEMSGSDFGEKLVDQALRLGCEIELDRVSALQRDQERFRIIGETGIYDGYSVIIAAGSKHRELGIPRERELVGRGVCYCAVCDGAFYRGKRAVVVGGGNSALQEAVFLKDICRDVTLVQNLDDFTGEEALLTILKKAENVHFITGCVVSALNGNPALEEITVLHTGSGEEETLQTDAVFVAIGQEPDNSPFEPFVTPDEYGYIPADETCILPEPGLFAAGDCRTKRVRQIVTATADGAQSAIAACRYVDSLKVSG